MRPHANGRGASSQQLADRGILVRCKSMREIAEEAPGAYKDVTLVVESAVQARLAKLVPGSNRWCASRARMTAANLNIELQQGGVARQRTFSCETARIDPSRCDSCSSWLTLWRAPLIL